MDVLEMLRGDRHESLHVMNDEATGAQAIIALHSTRLGPAIGGARCLPYASGNEALVDALRLARGMSYKAAISALPHGGGKSVIRLPEGGVEDRAGLFARFGAFVDGLSGQYLTSEDSGTSPADMDVIRRVTPNVLGSSSGSGDPSPSTARGVRRGMEAVARFQFGREDLEGMHVALQGLGHVGMHLARDLHARGCRLTVADVRRGVVEEAADVLGAEVVSVEEIVGVRCDIFSPCALGAVIDDATLPMIQARAICGAANNVLAEDRHGVELFRRGILYAPDYAVNAGGLIQVAFEHAAAGRPVVAAEVAERVDGIYDTMLQIFERARGTDTPPSVVADRIAEERLYGVPSEG